MNATMIRKLFGYNAWANGRTLGALASVPREGYAADRKSSHGGMHGTMLHIVWAQHLWLLRWMGRSQESAIARRDAISTFEDLGEYWKEVDAETRSFLDAKLSDALLDETFTMKTTKGDTYTHIYRESMLHLIIHSGYHRGQVTTLLRQAGQTPPNTDYITYERHLRSAEGRS